MFPPRMKIAFQMECFAYNLVMNMGTCKDRKNVALLFAMAER
jgi:hypothetical protein